MSAWRKEPPTHKEWRESGGFWWVKFLLAGERTEEIDGQMVTWPEVWYTDVVAITCSYEKGRLLDPSAARLHGRGSVAGRFDLDDPQATKNMYWQPVVPPQDDVKDQRPEID